MKFWQGKYSELKDAEIVSEVDLVFPVIDLELAREMVKRGLGPRVACVIEARDRRYEQAQGSGQDAH